jgi:hypothetical protein
VRLPVTHERRPSKWVRQPLRRTSRRGIQTTLPVKPVRLPVRPTALPGKLATLQEKPLRMPVKSATLPVKPVRMQVESTTLPVNPMGMPVKSTTRPAKPTTTRAMPTSTPVQPAARPVNETMRPEGSGSVDCDPGEVHPQIVDLVRDHHREALHPVAAHEVHGRLPLDAAGLQLQVPVREERPVKRHAPIA